MRAALVAGGDPEIARRGDDDDVVTGGILQCGPDERVAHDVADRVRTALTRPYLLRGGRFMIGASIGVAFWRPGATAAELMREADLAMYDAKSAGKGRVVVHELTPTPAGSVARPVGPQPQSPEDARTIEDDLDLDLDFTDDADAAYPGDDAFPQIPAR